MPYRKKCPIQVDILKKIFKFWGVCLIITLIYFLYPKQEGRLYNKRNKVFGGRHGIA